ncbi:glycosyltransferase [Fredinandcohnia sp. 179-A 10B2 NHS]|uniref:glycosyltransferase n=1 Tax=Fredinandcohnia sp. 179-A 10B2 NHS TaxID=3235176 RepID=UPI00399F4AFD
MKKILFMVTSMNIGGVEKSLLSLLSIIPRDKFEVTILLLEKKGGFLDSIPSWVKIEETNWFHEIKPIIMQSPYITIKGYFKSKKYLKMLHFIISYLIDRKFDNRYFYYKEILRKVPNYKKSYDIAVAFQGPTDLIDFYILNKVDAMKKISCIHFDISKHKINEKFYKKLYHRFDKLLVVSKEARNRLIEKFPNLNKKAHVFYNIVSNELIETMAKESIDFDVDYKGIKIVTVGRLSREKGQDLAIKVLAKLHYEGYEVRWYCVGDGKEKQEYENLINSYDLNGKFILIGAKINPYPYIANADIYVQTSRHEGYCLTLAEAKILNKPIVTTNFTGASEQIDNGQTGFVVEFNEVKLYEKLKHLIENKYERERVTKENIVFKTTHNSFSNFIS